MRSLKIPNRILGLVVVIGLVVLTLTGLYLVAKSYKVVHPVYVGTKQTCPTPKVEYVVITATPAPTASPSAALKKQTVLPSVVKQVVSPTVVK